MNTVANPHRHADRTKNITSSNKPEDKNDDYMPNLRVNNLHMSTRCHVNLVNRSDSEEIHKTSGIGGYICDLNFTG